MQTRLAVAATLLVAMALAGVAVADTTTVDDRRNVRANLFDIKQASAGHRSNLLRHTVDTFRSWRSKELKMSRRQPRIICIYVWKAGRDAGKKQDFEICSAWKDGELRASVLQVRPKHKRVASAKVHRLSKRSITYDFDPKAIGDPVLRPMAGRERLHRQGLSERPALPVRLRRQRTDRRRARSRPDPDHCSLDYS